MSHLEESRKVFLRKIIRRYYSLKPLEEPVSLHRREIALESLEDNVYIRHISFPYMERLYDFILNKKTPLHLYYSSAIYDNPGAEDMESKIWRGSELIFDIDADKYPGCSDEDVYICPNTGTISTEKIDKCPDGSEPVNYSPVTWDCLVKAYEGAIVLLDVLKTELGFKNIEIYFSGNRGFHVRVLDESALLLDRDSRRLIADYVSCSELNVESMFPTYANRVLFGDEEYGIRGRVIKYLESTGVFNRSKIGKLVFRTAPRESLEEALGKVCVNVDKVVTMDPSRLSRFGASLNMKAGLKVTRIDPEKSLSDYSYEKFSPFRGEIRVKALVTTSKLRVLDQEIELKRGDIKKFEAYIGILLVIKKLGVVVDDSNLEVIK